MPGLLGDVVTKPASALNVEFDSRIIRVSTGTAGITRPRFTLSGELQQVYCLNCGRPGGAVTSEIPHYLRGDPGVIYVCGACSGLELNLPPDAISFERYRT